MADIKMNQFTPASDGAYIYAEAADGSQVKISKEDLANLISNIIDSKGLYPFQYKGRVYGDMNNYTESGMYYYNTSIQIANRPGVIYGGLIVSTANGWI